VGALAAELLNQQKACVYFQCRGPAVLAARVLSGDADEMHETDNPLCAQHVEQLVMMWLHEVIAGGPAQRVTLRGKLLVD